MTSARSTNPHKIRTKLVRVISLSFVLFRGSCLVVPLTNLKEKGRFVIFQQPASAQRHDIVYRNWPTKQRPRPKIKPKLLTVFHNTFDAAIQASLSQTQTYGI